MNTLDHKIELLATREIDDAAVQDAQQKLEAVIAARMPRARRARSLGGWMAAAASAVVAALALLWLPLNPTPAFAAVQQHFRDFNTLRFVIDQRVSGEQTIQTLVCMTKDGNVRTAVGDGVTVIVNSTERRVLTLIRGEHMAIAAPLKGTVQERDELDWLQDVRDFQGAARALPESRVIDGQTAHGWQLDVQGIDMVLWATDDGLPLSMSMKHGAELQLDFRFEFNVPLAPELFSTKIPAGYSLAPQED